MDLTQELTQAFSEHESRTGNKPSKLRIHENLWEQLKNELEYCSKSVEVEKSEETRLQFAGADVTLVKSKEDPMVFLRYSIQ